ncbi:Coatomer beta subunit (COPB1) [Gracilaria domingensis]|nr:Coatomer beta subunit (COPB1) [Gracilaria domingensis]
MTTALERQCTLLLQAGIQADDLSTLRQELETGDAEAKQEALKRAIYMHLSGEPLPGMLMLVIRFVLPHEDTLLRKLGLYYLEICDKHDSDGKMLPEMILVCNMVRNELVHPNEYSRGVALRFVCKIHDAEILEPLIPAIRQNLEHRHSFVRRNAVQAILTIFEKFEFLIPDAAELVEEFLINEGDLAARRNAFVMLCQSDQERAIAYLNRNVDQILLWGATLQLSVLELVRRVCRSNPMEKGHYMKIIFSLLQSSSAAVVYESANTITALSNAPSAVRAAAQCYSNLLVSQSENTVKLILLERIGELKGSHINVLQELVMDFLRALSCPNLEIRRKAIELAMDLLTKRNVEEVMGILWKELVRTISLDKAVEGEAVLTYRQLLIKAVHMGCMRFPEVCESAVNVLSTFFSDAYDEVATDVVLFYREICERYPSLRGSVLSKLRTAVPSVNNTEAVRVALWIIGSYSEDMRDVKEALQAIIGWIGQLPLGSKAETEPEEREEKEAPAVRSRPVVLADGTYASQAAVSSTDTKGVHDVNSSDSSIRNFLMRGEHTIGVALCTTLTKLWFRLGDLENVPAKVTNRIRAEIMLVCTSVLNVDQSTKGGVPMDKGTRERVVFCINAISSGDSSSANVWLSSSLSAFDELVRMKEKERENLAAEKAKSYQAPVEDVIDFRLLRSRRANKTPYGDVDVDQVALTSATFGTSQTSVMRPSRVVQLTGMSDAVYAEAQIGVQQYDIIIDVLIINTTTDTLQNLTLEIATMGDLRLCERPQPFTMSPGSKKKIRTNVKVSSTESGIIFGNIVYDVGSGSQSQCIILNDIHVDVMDYIEPGEVSDSDFRSMWAEFEWENKVAVNTSFTDLGAFLNFVTDCTNMRCLTLRGIEEESGYLAANLYARSAFGEDALLNLCVEKLSDGTLSGNIRIRSKTQGIALSLGDRITLRQSNASDGK